MSIRNPVLPGFHPDPSILRVGDDYYLATSTFEWYPGVRLHHSRDLVHWRVIEGVLTDRRLLDLTGVVDSGGVWAPCLTYVDGMFYLVFTDVESYTNGFWDTPNYLVTAPAIEGPWSHPVALHALGFDPSLFHDEDGSSWLVSMAADHRPGHSPFGGIALQQYDRDRRCLVGEPEIIFTGTGAGLTEGPHLYRCNGFYYLMTAEGGTGWEHQVTVARSADLRGPYEPDPHGPMISSWPYPSMPLQKAGHGSLVQTQQGEWYLAHLTARPLTERGPCILGRETALQRVEWSADGWPRVAEAIPHEEVKAPGLPAHPWPAEPGRDDFTSLTLGPRWSTLRRPSSPDWVSLTERPGFMRLRGGQSPSSRHEVSVVGQRIPAHRASFETRLDFEPVSFRQMAGLIAYYNTRNWHYLRVTHDAAMGRCVDVMSCDRGRLSVSQTRVAVQGPVTLRAELHDGVLRFLHNGQPLPATFDATILSDEYATEWLDGQAQAWGFTGAFFCLAAHDLTGGRAPADFAYASMQMP